MLVDRFPERQIENDYEVVIFIERRFHVSVACFNIAKYDIPVLNLLPPNIT